MIFTLILTLSVGLQLAGLAILVNTCCQKTQEHYSKFCAHVTAVATLDKDLVPVTNRYEFTEIQLNSFMHGYVLDIPNSYMLKICGCFFFFSDYLEFSRFFKKKNINIPLQMISS